MNQNNRINQNFYKIKSSCYNLFYKKGVLRCAFPWKFDMCWTAGKISCSVSGEGAVAKIDLLLKA